MHWSEKSDNTELIKRGAKSCSEQTMISLEDALLELEEEKSSRGEIGNHATLRKSNSGFKSQRLRSAMTIKIDVHSDSE